MLLDTSGLLCLAYQAEPFHSEAVHAYQAAQVRATHSYVLAEYVALATARRFPRLPVLEYLEDLMDNLDIDLIWVADEGMICTQKRLPHLNVDSLAMLYARSPLITDGNVR